MNTDETVHRPGPLCLIESGVEWGQQVGDPAGLWDAKKPWIPWTEITLPYYYRAGQRHARDLTDAEWALLMSFIPIIVG